MRALTTPPYGRDFQLPPAEGINGAFGPIKYWGLQPQYLFIFENYLHLASDFNFETAAASASTAASNFNFETAAASASTAASKYQD